MTTIKTQVEELKKVIKQLKEDYPFAYSSITTLRNKRSLLCVASRRAFAVVLNNNGYGYEAISDILKKERTTVGHYLRTHEGELKTNHIYRVIYTNINLFYQNYLKEHNECKL